MQEVRNRSCGQFEKKQLPRRNYAVLKAPPTETKKGTISCPYEKTAKEKNTEKEPG